MSFKFFIFNLNRRRFWSTRNFYNRRRRRRRRRWRRWRRWQRSCSNFTRLTRRWQWTRQVAQQEEQEHNTKCTTAITRTATGVKSRVASQTNCKYLLGGQTNLRWSLLVFYATLYLPSRARGWACRYVGNLLAIGNTRALRLLILQKIWPGV